MKVKDHYGSMMKERLEAALAALESGDFRQAKEAAEEARDCGNSLLYYQAKGVLHRKFPEGTLWV